MNKAKIFLFLFAIVSILDLVFVALDLPYRQFSKSLIIPCLILYFIFSTPNKKSYLLFIVALVFAWLGDVFLLFSGEQFFIYGLGSFLVMQLIYAFIFLKDWKSTLFTVLFSLATLIGYSVYFNHYLWEFTSDQRVAIIAYTVAITLMAFTGINRSAVLKGYSYVVIGVLLFVFSDTILAVNIFGPGLAYGGLAVMTTYILAQYFIVEGYAKHLRSLV